MDNNYISDVKTLFKNVTLNSTGAERTLYGYMESGEVGKAVNLMDNNDREVDNALSEYNPQNHPVMYRPNKKRKGDKPYITEKLPRTKERYINEIELFFLLGKPIEWNLKNNETDAFGLFNDFMDKYRMNSLIRKAKRLAGSETESAIVFHLTKNAKGDMNVKPFVVARSLGYSSNQQTGSGGIEQHAVVKHEVGVTLGQGDACECGYRSESGLADA